MFRKAERKNARLRLALCGPSGSGKTWSALSVARGVVGSQGRIALIDTENNSAELYAQDHEFDVCELEPPFSPERYIERIEEAQALGYDILIVDSLSHAWAGTGGVLNMVDDVTNASNAKNSYTAWRNVTPEHNRLVDALLGARLHLMACMRTKTVYEMVENTKGKRAPQKMGMAPIQREGLDYEFTVVLDLALKSNLTTTSKDRTRLFRDKHVRLDETHGVALREWLELGVDPAEALLEQYTASIGAAADLVTLRATFEEGYRKAEALDSQHAIDRLIAAKDVRKETFETELTAALEPAGPDIGDGDNMGMGT